MWHSIWELYTHWNIYWENTGIYLPYYALVLGSKNNSKIHGLVRDAMSLTKLQAGSHNIDAPCHNHETEFVVKTVSTEVVVLELLEKYILIEWISPEDHTFLIVPAHCHTDVAKASKTNSLIVFASFLGEIHQRCTILLFLFGCQSPHDVMAHILLHCSNSTRSKRKANLLAILRRPW